MRDRLEIKWRHFHPNLSRISPKNLRVATNSRLEAIRDRWVAHDKALGWCDYGWGWGIQNLSEDLDPITRLSLLSVPTARCGP